MASQLTRATLISALWSPSAASPPRSLPDAFMQG
jgi:hypothetical protein